uniref:Reverse transcriptase domain-containing protein n=1 Tax=Leptobrachium leishanense TaxID=445787 RepID=A0A8C5MBB2_9ANUR
MVLNSSSITFMNIVKQAVDALPWKRFPKKNNLSTRERRALQELSKNKKITIKPADKGGLVVVQNTEEYHAEVTRQLFDRTNYKVLKSNPTAQIIILIRNVVQAAIDEGTISDRTGQYLCTKFPTIPVFYTLPKVHKGVFPPPGRPIVAGTDSVFQPLAIFVDQFLQPLVPKTKSFLKDTKDFLLKLRDLAPPIGSILVTLDVNSLYTSIPHNEGLRAVRQHLSESAISGKMLDFVSSLLEIVLKKNYFRYGTIFYEQCKGTAMGANMAPAYANLYMSSFEDSYIWFNNPFLDKVFTWFRYIDDCFLIWTGNSCELQQFFEFLNSRNLNITFTMESNHESVHFLDVLVYKEGNKLATDLYVKSTDVNSFLDFSSYHPVGQKKSIPYSQMLRVKRIVSDHTRLDTRLHTLSTKFRDKGYTRRVLQQAQLKTLGVTREALLLDAPKKKMDRLPFVSTYS